MQIKNKLLIAEDNDYFISFGKTYIHVYNPKEEDKDLNIKFINGKFKNKLIKFFK